MKHTPLFSVIMPVYNVEKYIETAIDSILGQTYNNLELILVDDYSPDNSGIICDQYAKKDERVKVVHKRKNEGLGAARNTGIENANGEWILFIDSDDWIDKNALETLVRQTEDEELDIIVWGYIQEYENLQGEIIKRSYAVPKNKRYCGYEEIGQAVLETGVERCFNYAWNKLYKKSLLDSSQMKFDNTILMEDFVFNIKIFPIAKRILVLEQSMSHYRKPLGETLVSRYYKGFFELCKMKVDSEIVLLKKTGNFKEPYIEMAVFMHVKHILSVCLKECSSKSGLEFIEQYKRLKQILKDNHTREILNMSKVKNKKIRVIQEILKINNGILNILMIKSLNVIMK